MAPLIGHARPGVFSFWKVYTRRRNWPNIARMSLAGFLSLLVVLVHDVQISAGQIAVLPMVLTFLYPPGHPTLVFFIHTWLGGLVVLACWGWGMLGFRIATSLRDLNRDDEIIKNILGGAIGPSDANLRSADLEAVLYPEVLEGIFLQTGVSIFWALWGGVALFVTAAFRGWRLRTWFAFCYSSILLTTYMCIAPLIPHFKYATTVSYLVLIPFSYYLAITWFCIFLIPTTVSRHVILNQTDCFRTHNGIFQSIRKLMAAEKADETILQSTLIQCLTFRDAYRKIRDYGGYFQKVPKRMLRFDIFWGRYSPSEVRRLDHYVNRMSIKMGGLLAFVRRALDVQCLWPNGATETIVLEEKMLKTRTGSEDLNKNLVLVPTPSSINTVQSSMDKIKNSTSALALSEIITQAFGQFQGFIDREGIWGPWRLVRSWFGVRDDFNQSRIQRSQEILALVENLKKGIEEFNRESGELLREVMPSDSDINPGLSRSDSEQTISVEDVHHPIYGEAYLISQYSFSLLEIARTLEEALTFIADLEGRTKFRLHFPAFHGWMDYATGLFGTAEDEEGEDMESSAHYEPEKLEKLVVTSEEGPGMLKIYGDFSGFRRMHPVRTLQHWINSRFFIFAWKAVLVGVLLCAPAWDSHSCKWYYAKKGQWAAILAIIQTGMWTGQITMAALQTVAGIVLSSVGALVVWYIAASGSHNGNPYALAVLCGIVLFPPMITLRWYSGSAVATAGLVASSTLIIGYSWLDGAAAPYLNVGVGWRVWYIRMLTVIIAIGGAYIVAFINPYRCRFHARKTLSNNFFRIGNAFTESKRLVKIGSYVDSSSSESEKTVYGGSSENSIAAITQHILKSHTKLRLCVMSMFGSQYEFDWTGETFTPNGQWELWEREPEILDLVAQFAVTQRYMGSEKRTKLLQSVAMSETVNAAIFNLLYLMSSALKTLRPYPLAVLNEDQKIFDQEMSRLNWTLPAPGSSDKDYDGERAIIVAAGGVFALWRELHNAAICVRRELKPTPTY